ncbi:MAG: 6,7-dimethyl-8-ribityllumazine synthase [Hyphomicrobiaceae bacterium]
MAGKAPRPAATSETIPEGTRVLIVESRYYREIADHLAAGAIAELEGQGIGYERIAVPGALEIPQALAGAVEAGLINPRVPAPNRFGGVVALGCVIRGETSHYDIVCANANHWLMQVAIEYCVPVGNGILTVDNAEQALARAKGGRESKGAEAARACLRLIALGHRFHADSYDYD